MPKVNPALLSRLEDKLSISRRRVYELIDQEVSKTHLPRPLAAISLASRRGVSISKYASEGDLATIRQTAASGAPAPVVVPPDSPTRPAKVGRTGSNQRRTPQKRRGTSVFVVHGRNKTAANELFQFLRAVGLRPLEWVQAIRKTKQGSPYVGRILDTAFSEAAAVVVLLTPDDVAKLKPQFLVSSDPEYERRLTGQARPNVLFEAGMAFGRNPDSTVLVELGTLRPFSDVVGRHVVHLSDDPASRQELVTKLANAGCNVDTSGSDWLTSGRLKL